MVRNGFTLIEMLLVVLILAVLASIVVPRIASSTTNANNAKDDANWANLIRALELYAVNNGGVYPADNTAFQADVLNSSTYFPHGAPVCPYGNAYVYVGDATGGTVTKHAAGN
jgi:type II secretion system protein G